MTDKPEVLPWMPKLAVALWNDHLGICASGGVPHIIDLIAKEYAAHAPKQYSAGECICPQHGRWLAAEDIYRMVRELDVAMHGINGAAKQAMLCDIYPELLSHIKEPSVPRAVIDEAIATLKAYSAGRVPSEFEEGIEQGKYAAAIEIENAIHAAENEGSKKV
jgi:hypothetical protein